MLLRSGLCDHAMLTRRFIPILFSCHLTVFSLTLPSLINVTTERTVPSDDDNGIRNAEPHCTQDRPTTSILPLLPDCLVAVRMLPHNDYVGTFHVGGGASLWRLPHIARHDSCTILVNLHEDRDVELGSWEDVLTAAVEAAIQCRSGVEPTGERRTGGWITAGAENGIVINVLKSRVQGSNGTVAASLVDVE